MRMYDLIEKKKMSRPLSDEEIKFFVEGYTRGDIPDYQASALCMAICFCGMTNEESASLTYHMMRSGDTLDLSSLPRTVDKHSTGGVGDKTSLIVAPTVASLGCTVAKMSGRGLGHTGGTIDKLESIPGFRTSLSIDEFFTQVKKVGVAIIGQTGNLAPADKKLYALRDVTATVDSIPLIASSIMSKKLAAGAESIVLDVKCGSGAFMKTVSDARTLARTMVNIGRHHGRKIRALITNMDKPLGHNVGNSLEVIEAVRILREHEKGELYDICVALASNMVSLAHGVDTLKAKEMVKDSLESGAAYTKFLEWTAAQGGDISAIENDDLLVGKHALTVKAPVTGYISKINAEEIGRAACILGAGRVTKNDIPDLSAGIVISAETGDYLEKGDTICTLYSSTDAKLSEAEEKILSVTEFSNKKPETLPLIFDLIS